MIDSLMPLSDTSGLSAEERREQSSKRCAIESEVPRCKKLKKDHGNWSKKSRHSHDSVKYKCKYEKKVRPKPVAPFNSTQFIMEEHDYLNDSDLSTVPVKPRDSSSSMDSDDYAEDILLWDGTLVEQKNFMTQQFWSTYHDLNAERLHGLSKAQLVQDYLVVEEKLNILEKQLSHVMSRKTREPSPSIEEVEEAPPGEVPVDAETAAKIEVFRNEINKLTIENDSLRSENEALSETTSTSSCRRCALRGSNLTSSEDEDTSSSSSNDSYDSDPTSSADESANARKLMLSSLSPPTSAKDDLDSKGENVILETKKVVKGSVDLVSDSGIASASSGDDLKSDEVFVIEMNQLKSPVYNSVR